MSKKPFRIYVYEFIMAPIWMIWKFVALCCGVEARGQYAAQEIEVHDEDNKGNS